MKALNLIGVLAGSLLMAGPAVAEPIDDFMARLGQYLGAAGGSVTYAIGAGYSDANKSLAPLVLTAPSGEAIPLGDNAYIGKITPLPGDIILGEGLQIANFSRTFAGVTASASSLIMDLALPPLGTTDPLILAQSVKGASIFGLHIEEGGVPLDVDNIGYFLFVNPAIGAPDPANLTFNLQVEGLTVTEAMLQKMTAPTPLSMLAGRKVDLDLRLNWTREESHIGQVSLEVQVADFGDIAFSIHMGGVSDAMIAQLVALGQALSATGATPELQQQAIPLLGQLTIREIYSGIFNEGGGEVVLATVAEGSGTGSVGLLKTGARDLRAGLNGLGLPEMAATVSDAFVTMMMAEGGIVVSGAPEALVSVLEAVALGSTSPQALVDRLGLEARYDPPLP